MPRSLHSLGKPTAIVMMLAAAILSVCAAPLHEVLEHSGEAAACASSAQDCHAGSALPGIASHPLDDCFELDFHGACAQCVLLAQSSRGLVAAGAAPLFPHPARHAMAARLAASHPAPVSGADPARGPPAA